LETAVDVTAALSAQHPLVLKHVHFIGTPSQLNKWAADHPEINKASKSGKHPVDLAKDGPLGSSAVAVAHPIGEKPYTQSVIVVLPSWWSKQKADAAGKKEHKGFSLSNTLKSVVTHELGHTEAQVMRHLGVGKASMWEVWKKHCVPMLKGGKSQLINDVSQYAATNPHECWAEISVLRRRGGKIAPWIMDAVDEMGIDKNEWSDGAATGWSKA